MTVDRFVDELKSISLPNVFNPYRDTCRLSDHVESAAVRRRNIARLLDAIISRDSCSLWLGRDLGYRGGRRTGIALTDEFHLQTLEATFRVEGIARATVDTDPVKERTATQVWKLLRQINQPVFLWNAFPFHPFEPNEPFSNRRHTAAEFDACRHILKMLIDWLQPTTIVALGGDAETAVRRLGYCCQRVRHPSYGGHTEFTKQISKIYDVIA